MLAGRQGRGGRFSSSSAVTDRARRAGAAARPDEPDVTADGSAASKPGEAAGARAVGGRFPTAKAVVSPAGETDHAAEPAGPASDGEPTAPVPVASRRSGTSPRERHECIQHAR